MTDLVAPAIVVMLAMPAAAALAAFVMPSLALASAINRISAFIAASAVAVLCVEALADTTHAHAHFGLILDPAAVSFLIATGFVGLMSVLLSPTYLGLEHTTLFGTVRPYRWYYLLLNLFWAALLLLPLISNLAVAWITIEATTATSAVLVAFSGKRRALEAGWKYLILTTLGLTLTFFGMVMIYAATPHASGLGLWDWRSLAALSANTDGRVMTTAFVLIVVGLAAKIGWAPVHNWLPDAHSEAPSPISMVLSAALLPTMILVAWRTKDALAPGLPTHMGDHFFVAFGLLSLAVSIPFLWQPLPWKRFLAYSSLEHMGIVALGIGFGSPLAIAGACLHVVAHALAKWLGFHTVIPLTGIQPSIAKHPPRGIFHESPSTASAIGISLYSLAGMPPSPIFISELLILIGGIQAGYKVVVAVAAVLLTLAFVGLAQSFIQALAGKPTGEPANLDYAGVHVHTAVASVVGIVASAALLAAAASVNFGGILTQLARGIA
jgi:hydrogenase-4 component F